jgi:hypothetical protein
LWLWFFIEFRQCSSFGPGPFSSEPYNVSVVSAFLLEPFICSGVDFRERLAFFPDLPWHAKEFANQRLALAVMLAEA